GPRTSIGDLVDAPGLAHPLEDKPLPPHRGRKMAARIERARRLRDAGQERGLGDRELRRGLAEVGLARAADADDAVAVGEPVQVLLEDPGLLETLLDDERAHDLLGLVPETARPAVDALDELLGDGRRAARPPPRPPRREH